MWITFFILFLNLTNIALQNKQYFLEVLILFGLSVILTNLFVFIAVITTITILFWLPLMFYSVNSLGSYPPLHMPEESSSESSTYGETFWEKFFRVLFVNVFIGISLFITLIFIFNTLPEIFLNFPNTPLIQNTTLQIMNWNIPLSITKSNLSITDIAFDLALFTIPAFLLSLRLLANPRRDMRIFIYKNISTEEEIRKIRFFKEQIISFYFSFIASTIAIFYFASCFTAMRYNGFAVLSVLISFAPTMDTLSVIILLTIEVFSIIFLTYLGEIYLKWYEPIDKS